jgi:hypothetical protein
MNLCVKISLIFTLATIFVLPQAKARGEFNICYISMNNEKESKYTKDFVQKINQSGRAKEKINVIEFHRDGEKPEESFRKMVESGTVCHGLVISGHHTGAFGGHRASGSLSLDFIEDLSCQEEFKSWFENVNALWLQGCRTVGAEIAVSEQDHQDQVDFHARRVANVAEEDGLEQSEWQMMQEFAMALDQSNPYSSRFLRAFPKATVFGWTETAPGELSQSEKSLAYHIHNVAKFSNLSNLMKDNGASLDRDPTAENLSQGQKGAYFKALKILLSEHKNEKTLEACQVGWQKHGNPEGDYFGFLNSDLMSLPPLALSDNELLKLAKTYECVLKTSDDLGLLEETLTSILQSPSLIKYSLNSLLEILARYDQDSVSFQRLQSVMQASPYLLEFLETQMNSNHIGLARKLDYLGFYLLVYDTKGVAEKEAFLARSIEVLKEPISYNDYFRRDTKEALLSGLFKYGLVDRAFIRELFTHELDATTERALTSPILNSSHKRPQKRASLIEFIVQLPNVSDSLVLKFFTEGISSELRPYIDHSMVYDFISRYIEARKNLGIWAVDELIETVLRLSAISLDERLALVERIAEKFIHKEIHPSDLAAASEILPLLTEDTLISHPKSTELASSLFDLLLETYKKANDRKVSAALPLGALRLYRASPTHEHKKYLESAMNLFFREESLQKQQSYSPYLVSFANELTSNEKTKDQAKKLIEQSFFNSDDTLFISESISELAERASEGLRANSGFIQLIHSEILGLPVQVLQSNEVDQALLHYFKLLGSKHLDKQSLGLFLDKVGPKTRKLLTVIKGYERIRAASATSVLGDESLMRPGAEFQRENRWIFYNAAQALSNWIFHSGHTSREDGFWSLPLSQEVKNFIYGFAYKDLSGSEKLVGLRLYRFEKAQKNGLDFMGAMLGYAYTIESGIKLNLTYPEISLLVSMIKDFNKDRYEKLLGEHEISYLLDNYLKTIFNEDILSSSALSEKQVRNLKRAFEREISRL